ncbi:MAG: beta-propeller fold lactonase family protein [Bryobacteraceae bacterium]|nr:beta-propeller fold lactonase family protein [Bryobacteraceae bacterium]
MPFRWGLALAAFLFIHLANGATFGTEIEVPGGVADIVLDAPRNRLYLISLSDRVTVYSITQRRVLSTITTGALPLAGAMSRDGSLLYVAAHNASAMNVIDLETLGVVRTINLPARPEGVAVGGDGRVLISTIGAGANNALSVLLLFNPAEEANRQLSSISVAPPAPAPPSLPPVTGAARSNRSFLAASGDGSTIVGANVLANGSRTVFVYEVASATVLRSRNIGNISNVLSISNDGRKFMAGLTLFDSATLEILAQQNIANSPYFIAANTNFNLANTQGGSVFSPDGGTVYSAFNITTAGSLAQLMLSDPENLLIRAGIQLPRSLTGKLVLSPDGAGLYGISESGFMIVPIGTLSQQPIAQVDRTAVLLANDQCGAFANLRSGRVAVRNEGRGALGAVTATLQIAPGGPATGAATAPTVRSQPVAGGTDFEYTFSAANRTTLGTVNPFHDYAISATGAVNLPPQVRVFQNNRDTDARGEVIPIPVGISAAEGLTDLVYDAARQRVYISNSGLNRIEIYDIRTRALLAPVPVGQLPRSMALSFDGSRLYVANSGSEGISIVDLDLRRVIGRVRYPPIPLNAGVALVAPSIVVSTQSGPLVMMSNGTLWRVVGEDLVPRRLEAEVFGTATTLPAPRAMASTPNGEYAIVVAGNGIAYLYDASADRFIQSRQVFTAAATTGYIGGAAAGPRGTYFVVNGIPLNSALAPLSSTAITVNPIAGLTSVSATTYARLNQPLRANATAAIALPSVEVVDTQSGLILRRATVLESPTAVPALNGRSAVDSRTLALDASGTTAYALTISGLSIVPLDTPIVSDRPTPNNGGIVSLSSYLPSFAPGSFISIFGRNFGADAAVGAAPYPTLLGGMCVTLNNTPLPLISTSSGQINAQIPANLTVAAAGLNGAVLIRAVDRRVSSTAQTIRIARTAPGIFPQVYDSQSGQQVTRENPTTRDRYLTLYGTGFGTQFDNIPLDADVDGIRRLVQVYIGDPTIREAQMDVRWAGAIPGLPGIYQVNIYVPWYRLRGELPLTVRVAGVDSQKTGPVVPTVSVD